MPEGRISAVFLDVQIAKTLTQTEASRNADTEREAAGTSRSEGDHLRSASAERAAAACGGRSS